MSHLARSRSKALAIVAFCVGAAACTPDGATTGASLESRVPSQANEAMALAPSGSPAATAQRAPLAGLPGETAVSVKTRSYVNGLRQDILFRPGPVHTIGNGMTVIAQTSRQQTLDESVPLSKPTESGIRSEIGAQFPHVPMQVVDRQSSNSYGPYGLALGRVGADVRCLYAWQYVDGNRLPSATSVTGPVGVRVRLCEAGTTFDAMAAEVDHLQLGSDVPAPAGAPLVIGADGSRIIVAAADVAPARAHPSRASHPRRARHVAKRDAAPQPTGLAPVAAPRETASVEPPGSPTPTLAGDLPAQAYLGPKASARPFAATPTAY